MSVTLKEIAKLAGVSTATVSHVLNHTRYVSEETRERVQRVIDETGYQPNMIARSLRSGESSTIGLLIPDISNQFFAEIAKRIEDDGFDHNYSVILCNSAEELSRESTYIDVLIANQVAGIILIATESKQDQLMRIKSRKIPLVLVDREIPLFFGDVVLVNNEQGGYVATNYLIELGHRKIACIRGSNNITPSADRVKGYKRALQENGINFRDEYIIKGDFGCKSGEDSLMKLMSLTDLPSAIFVCNDMMAIGVLKKAKEISLPIPEDMSIIGFDNIQFSAMVTPALTTIAQPIDMIASTAISRLINNIKVENNQSQGIRIVLDTHLVVRESCMPFKVNLGISN